MKWVLPKYTFGQINKAGKALISELTWERDRAMIVDHYCPAIAF